MGIIIKELSDTKLSEALTIWNSVVEDGIAFPQTELLSEKTGRAFSKASLSRGLTENSETGEILGLYILHPNNVSRCSHICNASYAVKKSARGQHIGEALVRHSMEKGAELGFKILQFNAVVKTNAPALKLYEKLGFIKLGTIPKGFLSKDRSYEDIIPHYIEL